MSRTDEPEGDPWTSLVSPCADATALPLKSTMTSPVMMPQLSEPFGLSAFTVVLMLDPFYCGRSPFTLVAGAAVDRLGLRTVLPIAAAASLLANTGQCGVSARSEGADHPDQPSQ